MTIAGIMLDKAKDVLHRVLRALQDLREDASLGDEGPRDIEVSILRPSSFKQAQLGIHYLFAGTPDLIAAAVNDPV